MIEVAVVSAILYQAILLILFTWLLRRLFLHVNSVRENGLRSLSMARPTMCTANKYEMVQPTLTSVNLRCPDIGTDDNFCRLIHKHEHMNIHLDDLCKSRMSRLMKLYGICERNETDKRDNREFELLGRIETPNSTLAASCLLGKLYAIMAKTGKVLVYVANTPSMLITEIPISGMDPVGIVSNYVAVCLYILDNGNGCVWKMKNNYTVAKVIDGLDAGSLISITVLKGGRLLLVLRNGRILVYNNTGQIQVSLHATHHATDMRLSQVLETSNGLVVVSEDELIKVDKNISGLLRFSGDEALRTGSEVVEARFVGGTLTVGSTAVETRPYKIETAKPGKANRFTSAASDGSGRFFFTDAGCHRVLRLNTKSELDDVEVVLSLAEDGIEQPRHVMYAFDTGHLVVCWSNYVDVYVQTSVTVKSVLLAGETERNAQFVREAVRHAAEVGRHVDAERLDDICRQLGASDAFLEWHHNMQRSGIPQRKQTPHATGDKQVVHRVDADSVHELFSWFATQPWAVQYYVDVNERKVHIGVDGKSLEEAENAVHSQNFGSLPPLEFHLPYAAEVRDSVGSDDDDGDHHRETQESQTTDASSSEAAEAGDDTSRTGLVEPSPPIPLYPSWNIRSGQSCFLFAGSLIDSRTGMTVAHATDTGKVVSCACHPEASDEIFIIGKCRLTLPEVVNAENIVTADLAVLDLSPEKCRVRNTVQYPPQTDDTESRTYTLRLFKNVGYPADKDVMIRNRFGRFSFGKIRRYPTYDTACKSRRLYNVLLVSKDDYTDSPISELGDSGAPLMSTPDGDSDELFVYGFVTGVLEMTDNTNSFTISNSLSTVIKFILGNAEYRKLFTNITDDMTFDEVDFAPPDNNNATVDDAAPEQSFLPDHVHVSTST